MECVFLSDDGSYNVCSSCISYQRSDTAVVYCHFILQIAIISRIFARNYNQQNFIFMVVCMQCILGYISRCCIGIFTIRNAKYAAVVCTCDLL